VTYAERIVELVQAGYELGVTREHAEATFVSFVDGGLLKPAPALFAKVLIAKRDEPADRDWSALGGQVLTGTEPAGVKGSQGSGTYSYADKGGNFYTADEPHTPANPVPLRGEEGAA